jgi:hypothetical protein
LLCAIIFLGSNEAILNNKKSRKKAFILTDLMIIVVQEKIIIVTGRPLHVTLIMPCEDAQRTTHSHQHPGLQIPTNHHRP